MSRDSLGFFLKDKVPFWDDPLIIALSDIAAIQVLAVEIGNA